MTLAEALSLRIATQIAEARRATLRRRARRCQVAAIRASRVGRHVRAGYWWRALTRAVAVSRALDARWVIRRAQEQLGQTPSPSGVVVASPEVIRFAREAAK
jgi:hypothetical protein